MTSHGSLDALNDRALLSQFGDLVRQNQEANAQLLRHIDVIDRRKLGAKLGHPSMFDFLVTRHHSLRLRQCSRPPKQRSRHLQRSQHLQRNRHLHRFRYDVTPIRSRLRRAAIGCKVTISECTRDKLEQLQDLLARQIPNGDPAAIIERALDALLVQIHKRKTGITAKPRAVRPAPSTRRTRHLEVAVRREVWPRDEGRCGFAGDDGHRCNETRGLEFAHRQPWAKGGANTAVNIGLRCPAHNALEADRDYGARFTASRRQRKPLKVWEPLARYVLTTSTAPCWQEPA